MQRPSFLLLLKDAGHAQVICQPRRFRMTVYQLPQERMQTGPNDLVMYGSAPSQLYGFVYHNWHRDLVEPIFFKAITWFAETQLSEQMELYPRVPSEMILAQLL